MNEAFDQLTKSIAKSVTRRQALRRFGLGMAGMALAYFAPSSKADQSCLQSGSFCSRAGHGVGPSCGTCCSKSHFCFESADTGEQCECN